MQKPTVEQTAWVISKIVEMLEDPGTFRSLIYDKMGYDESAYVPLCLAGGMTLTNALFNCEENAGQRNALEALAKRFIEDRGCTCNDAEHRCGTNHMLEDLQAILGK